MEEGRLTCYVCFKPQVTCVCGNIRPVDNATTIHVLQHPRERAHPIGTARFVELGLKRSQVVLAQRSERDLVKEIELPPGTGLLFPRADSRDLETLPPDERPKGLVVLDGTWPHARSLYKRNEWLHALPHYRLSPDAPSRYRIRKEPSEDYVSTLESVVLALRVLEPELEGLEGLLHAFDAMVDAQISHRDRARKAGTGQRFKKRKVNRLFRGIPSWFGEEFESLVALYAEAMPLDDRIERPRELLQLCAIRLSDGARFERFVTPPSGLPVPSDLELLGLETSNFSNAKPGVEVVRELEEFMDGGFPLSWNRITPRLLREAAGQEIPVKLLRPITRGLDALGFPKSDVSETPPAQFEGRAAQRMANLVSLAKRTRERARR
ncbi:MAG: tRNA-uridine aminocarboxypropyltransferase [Polyangiales bacterium]